LLAGVPAKCLISVHSSDVNALHPTCNWLNFNQRRNRTVPIFAQN
jgi:hypothetical protein